MLLAPTPKLRFRDSILDRLSSFSLLWFRAGAVVLLCIGSGEGSYRGKIGCGAECWFCGGVVRGSESPELDGDGEEGGHGGGYGHFRGSGVVGKEWVVCGGLESG